MNNKKLRFFAILTGFILFIEYFLMMIIYIASAVLKCHSTIKKNNDDDDVSTETKPHQI